MLAASNRRQHKRLFEALGRPDLGDKDYEYREEHFDDEAAVIEEILATKTAQEWEDFLQSSHVPAGRVRRMAEALADPQLKSRSILHEHADIPGTNKPVTVPMCAFKYEHGGPSIEMPPPQFGEHNEEVLESLGYTKSDIQSLRDDGVI